MTATSTSLVDIRAQLKAQLEAQRSRVEGPSSARISTAGKLFTLPDGRTSQGPLSLVTLDWRITHAYYTGIYDPAKPKSPDCWAISETVNCAPDPAKVKTPKHSSCNSCPFNEYGSAGRGKACKETRRLAVAPLDAQVGDKPFLLEASPTAIKSFEGLVTALAAKGLTPLEVVTEVGFKSDATYPTLVFAPAAALTDEQLATMFEIRSRAAAILDRGMAID
jgi:hypothetical protein